MIEISFGFIISVCIAGILMFLAPCTLPLLPAYIAFISGVNRSEISNAQTKKHAQWLIMKNGVAFVLGFSFVFISLGVLAGIFGGFVGQFKNILSQVGGAFIILFGFLMLNVISIPALQTTRRVSFPIALTPGNPISSFVVGATFALGWTPCVGPILASVLLLASVQTTALQGAFLLSIFSLGLAVPFLFLSFAYAKTTSIITRFAYVLPWISRVGGVCLILLGILLMTGNFGPIVEYGYKVFYLVGFEGLFEHL